MLYLEIWLAVFKKFYKLKITNTTAATVVTPVTINKLTFLSAAFSSFLLCSKSFTFNFEFDIKSWISASGADAPDVKPIVLTFAIFSIGKFLLKSNNSDFLQPDLFATSTNLLELDEFSLPITKKDFAIRGYFFYRILPVSCSITYIFFSWIFYVWKFFFLIFQWFFLYHPLIELFELRMLLV